MLDVRVLGPVEVAVDGATLALGGPKQRAVLAMLVLRANEVVSVEGLLDGVWGPSAPDGATRSLQVYVSNLRKVLAAAPEGALAIVNQTPGYRLEVDPQRIDLHRATALTEAGRALLADGRAREAAEPLDAAVALWRGPVVADLALEPFASGGALDRLHEDRLTLEEDRLEAALSLGRHAEVLPELERLVDAEPLRERRWSLLMLALYRSERQADALRTFGRARSLLLEELGIDPGPALRQLEGRILAQDPSLDPAVAAPAGTTSHRPPLPRPISSLVGREAAVDEVTALVARPDARLITLLGPGGVGKTRLALAVASALTAEAPGGVAFVDLAAVDDPALVPAAIATGLGAEEALDPDPDERDAGLATLVGDQPTVVVLDNLEQVVDAGPVLVRILGAAPSLTFLATSRVALRVSGELTWTVPPLEVPADDESRSAAELGSVPAVALFVERSRAVAPTFELTEATAAGVADLCRRLDGLPLALELAAARTKLLAPADLAARLGRTLDVLVGARDLPDRQRTLRATLEWSEALLRPAERDLFARLGVFAGSFSVESAETVCGGPDGAPAFDVLEGLGSLVDSSLVRAVPAGLGFRFRLLQTVQAFALERLTALADRDAIRARHAERMQDLARAERDHLDGPDSSTALLDTAADEPDHRAALRFALDAGDADAAGRHAVALRRYWVAQGRLAEGRRWLGEVLERGPSSPEVRGGTLVAAGILAYYQDDVETAAELLGRGLELARAADSAEDVAIALCFVGTTHLGTADVAEAARAAAEALALARADDLYEPHTLSLALSAMVAGMSGDEAEEVRLREERLALARAHGDRIRIADSLNTLAEIALEQGDATRARTLAEEALPLARATTRIATRDVLLTLGRVALATEDAGAAAAHLGEATRLSVEFGQRYELAQCLRALAGTAAVAGDATRAAHLFGAADHLHRALGEGAFPTEEDAAARIEAARAALGDDGYARAFGAGGALDLTDAVALALAAPPR